MSMLGAQAAARRLAILDRGEPIDIGTSDPKYADVQELKVREEALTQHFIREEAFAEGITHFASREQAQEWTANKLLAFYGLKK